MAEIIRVLLVDDCEPIRTGLARAFSRASKGGGGELRAGASGFVSKDESIENLLHAIRTVARGGTWYSQRIAQKLAEWARAASMREVQLTSQETRVLRLLARGKTDAEIMAELGIGARTLRHHVQIAMEKIGVQERTQAVLWALEQGFGEKRLRELQDSYGVGQE